MWDLCAEIRWGGNEMIWAFWAEDFKAEDEFCVRINVLTCFSCVWLCDTMDSSPPGSSVHGILQAEYWSGLPCPLPGDLPNPGIEPTSLMSLALTCRFFITSATWEAPNLIHPPQNIIHILLSTCPSFCVLWFGEWYHSKLGSHPNTLFPSYCPLTSQLHCQFSFLSISVACALFFIFAASLRSNSHSLCPDWACSLKPTDASQQVSIIALIRGPARSWVTFQHGNVRYLNAGTFHKGVRMLPENWVLLLVGVKPRKPNQAKEREKEGSIITCSK